MKKTPPHKNTFPKSNIKIVETGKSLFLTHKYTTGQFPGLVQSLQQKVAVLNCWFFLPKPPLILK
jgi:hypothetical protein